MARNHLTALFCAAILLATPARVLGADREHQQIAADIRMLQEQTARLQLAVDQLDETVRHVLATMAAHTDAMRRAFADQQLAVGAVADGVRVLRERFDDTNVRISSLSQEVEALRIARPPFSPAAAEAAADPETGLPLDAPPGLSPGMSPQRMYDTAWADYTNGQWTLSIQGFETYIKTFPRSELADDAQF